MKMVKMAGRSQSWFALAGLAFASTLHLEGCTTDGDGGDTAAAEGSSALVAELLSAVGPSVVLPTLEELVETLDALDAALETWEAAIETSSDKETAHTAVQDGWRSTMRVWQQLEVMQIGPLGSSLSILGGEDLRDEIYSWPTVNRCRVDQKTASLQWQEEDFFTTNLVNSYGLDALEHMLFSGPDSVCDPLVPPVSDGSWEAMGAEGVSLARAGFSGRIVDEIAAQIEDLITTWHPDGGDYSGLLVAEGGNAIYSSPQEALNAVYHATFYIESTTKDRKLAQPLGLRDCEEVSCPEDLEGLISGETVPMVIANLEGFKKLFTGGADIGFDDLLVDLGHGDLAESMVANVEQSISDFENFEGSLYDAIAAGDPTAEDLLGTLTLLTAEIKWDLSTVLSLTVPEENKADND